MAHDDEKAAPAHGGGIVEVTRVQPLEAEAIAARLRASGIEATVGPDGSPYESIAFAGGVGVLVPAADAARARAMLEK